MEGGKNSLIFDIIVAYKESFIFLNIVYLYHLITGQSIMYMTYQFGFFYSASCLVCLFVRLFGVIFGFFYLVCIT